MASPRRARWRPGRLTVFGQTPWGAETAIRSGVGAVILDVRRGIGPSRARHYTFSALVGAERSIRDQPQIMESAVRAVCNAQSALRKDPALARQVGERLFPHAQAEMIAEVVRRDIDFYDPAISAESVLGVNSFARAMGLPTEDASYDNVVATGLAFLWGRSTMSVSATDRRTFRHVQPARCRQHGSGNRAYRRPTGVTPTRDEFTISSSNTAATRMSSRSTRLDADSAVVGACEYRRAFSRRTNLSLIPQPSFLVPTEAVTPEVRSDARAGCRRRRWPYNAEIPEHW